jgi:WD40 repeat protein
MHRAFSFVFISLSIALASQSARAADNQRLGDLRGVAAADFNHDASRVIVGMGNGDIGIWDVVGGTRVPGDLGTKTSFASYSMSPDAKKVLIGFKDGHSRVFDVSSGSAVSPILDIGLSEDRNREAFFSPDGRTIVFFGEKEASVLEVGSGKLITKIPIRFHLEDPTDSTASTNFTKSGDKCFLMDPAGTVTAYETKEWKPIGKPMRHPAAESAYEFGFEVSDDGKWIVTFDSPGENGPKGHLQVWDAVANKPLGPPIVATNGMDGRFLPGADRVLVMPGRGEGTVRELPSMKIASKIRPHDEVDGPKADISPDGKWLLAWGWDKTIELVDAKTGSQAKTYSADAAIKEVIMAPDSSGCYVVFDNTAFLLQGHHDYYVMKFGFPDFEITGSARILDYLLHTSLSPNGRRVMIQQGGTDHQRLLFLDALTLKLVESSKP